MRASRLSIGLAVGMQGLVACGNTNLVQSGDRAGGAEELVAGAATEDTFQACNALPPSTLAPKGFSYFLNNLYSELPPHHGAQDTIGAPGEVATIRAWYGYGVPGYALVNEKVKVQMDTCEAWDALGTLRTDGNGFISIPVAADRVKLGAYDVQHTVLADGSTMHSTVWGLPAGTHMVVFDIDGTLTTDNGQFIDQYAAEMFDAGYTPKAFAGAADLTNAWRAKGYIPVFLTGRPHNTADISRAWLANGGFADGPLHVTETTAQMASTTQGVGTYKADFLKSLLAAGYTVDYAYGNEPTDVYAYERIGMPLDHVFTIGSKAGVGGSTAIAKDYTAHVKAFVAGAPNAVQPFSF